MDPFTDEEETLQQPSPIGAVHRAVEKAQADVERSEANRPANPWRASAALAAAKDIRANRIKLVAGLAGALLLYLLVNAISVQDITAVRGAINSGSLKAIEAALDDVGSYDRWNDEDGVLLLADALLYRYADAAPDRFERVVDSLKAAPGDAMLLARILVSDIGLRAAQLDELLSSTPNQWVLSESVRALEQVGEVREAQKTLAKLLKSDSVAAGAAIAAAQATDPIHAGRLWDALATRGRGQGGWWRVATTQFLPGSGAGMPSVAAAEGHYSRALQLLEDKRGELARRHLERMGYFVGFQPVFMLDFAGRLIRSGHYVSAARVLDALEGERGDYADVLRGRILIAKGQSKKGLELLQRAWDRGSRDPTLVRDLLGLDGFNAVDEALELWPRNTDVALAKFSRLVDEERYDEASVAMFQAALWLRPRASDYQRAAFDTLFAESEFARGNVAGARNYIARALSSSSAYAPAKRLARKINAGR